MRKTALQKISHLARTIKSGLAMMIPILFIGSITVLLNGFPVQAYQDFLNSFLSGALRSIIQMIQYSTVGILAIYVTVALNISYMNRTDETGRHVFRFGSLLGCVSGFFILVGFFSGEPDASLLSGQGVFSAMVAGLVGSALFKVFERCFNTQKMVFVDGADSEFNAALHVILPFLCVTLVFATANHLITVCFRVQSLQHLFMKAMDAFFLRMHRSYSSGLLFVFLTSGMWWFGIHGNNVLNQVAEDMFTEIIPGEIVSKSFIDTFVNMGGTGCTIGLLLAMLVFGKRSSTKKLSGMAFLPGMFNIGEMMVFGFPIIYNPLMAIPFILAPVLCFSNAFLLTRLGFLPPVSNSVVWTTPALMSGFIATGSARGILVQLFNILISTACYAPFVILCEKKSLEDFSSALGELVGILKKSEETGEKPVLTECEGNAGRLAKHLAVDLEVSLSLASPASAADRGESPLMVHYQPQYDISGQCCGAEALLRWDHKRYGVVYPPLVIRIAGESGDLYDLETYIIERAVRDAELFRKRFGKGFRMCVNVTLQSFYDKRFIPFLQKIAERYMLRSGNICLEISEENELVTTEECAERMRMIRMYGYGFALDDFRMDHVSLRYLQHNPFELVKLDEELVRSVQDNRRSREIIDSIVFLSKSLDFKLAAVFVEEPEQKEVLEKTGCQLYQGYLFGPATDRDSFIGSGRP
ncbi:MAG: PTS sugar transporter subunit IIC/EAL domain-containing protein [Lachnospiraceae bacterium]|nr:PTS sugar transporter subunit IIC/EAL domain-containing protein [Lachnospiraceae bacterium]